MEMRMRMRMEIRMEMKIKIRIKMRIKMKRKMKRKMDLGREMDQEMKSRGMEVINRARRRKAKGRCYLNSDQSNQNSSNSQIYFPKFPVSV